MGIIRQTMPSLAISQVIRVIIGVMGRIIMGIIIGMPMLIMGFMPIIGIIPPTIGLMPMPMFIMGFTPIMGFMPMFIMGFTPIIGIIPPIIGLCMLFIGIEFAAVIM